MNRSLHGLRVIQTPLDPAWQVTGPAPTVAGDAPLSSAHFTMAVDATSPGDLVSLCASPSDPIGRTVLGAWLGHDVVEQLERSGACADVVPSSTSPEALMLGKIAVLTLLRSVDAGPRDDLWAAEITASWCDLAVRDHRLAPMLHDRDIIDGLDAVARVALTTDGRVRDLTEAQLDGLVRLVDRLAGFETSVETPVQQLRARLSVDTDRFDAAAFLGDDEDDEDDEGTPGNLDASGADVYRVAVDRTRLPGGLQLELDATLSVVRLDNHGVATLTGVQTWPPATEVFIRGRTPRTARMRMLDALTFDGTAAATTRLDFHESDFSEGAALLFDIVDRAGALGAVEQPADVAFRIARSELARLQLVSAEIESEFSGRRAEQLRREASVIAGQLMDRTSDVIDTDDVREAIDLAEGAAMASESVTLRMPRRLWAAHR